jgi:hypothetical protein
MLPTRRTVRSALALLPLLLAVLPARAAAQSPLLYGMNETGKVSVNGTVLDKLPSEFDPEMPNQNQFQKWQRLVVSGADRYALRLDGKLYKNGKSLYKLVTTVTTANGPVSLAWLGLAVGESGVYALREDGLLSLNGTNAVTLPAGGFFFTTCLAVTNPDDSTMSDVYSLRSDGAVFKNTLTTTPFLKFTGGPGINLNVSPPVTNAADGAGTETVWVDLAINPLTATLRGLRRDGKVSSGAVPVVPPDVQPLDPDLMALPYPTNPNVFVSEESLNSNRYRSLAFTVAGAFLALRGNGEVYSPLSLLDPLVDLPDGGNEPIDDTYLQVVNDGLEFYTIRWDGRVHRGSDSEELLNLTAANYRNIVVSHTSPDLTNFKNPKPLLSTYTATVVEGSSVLLPVYATDIEKTGDDLPVTLQDPLKKPLPDGLVFDPSDDDDPATLPTISWPVAMVKGTYTVPLVVTDGVNKPKTYNYKIKVILPDTNPEKNKKPVFTKVKNTQALVDMPFQLQMFAVDPDGDEVTLSVDTEKEPFATLGAEFDPVTGIFTWTPTFDDVGKVKVKFFATDTLLAEKSYTVTIKVVNSLIFPDSL